MRAVFEVQYDDVIIVTLFQSGPAAPSVVLAPYPLIHTSVHGIVH